MPDSMGKTEITISHVNDRPPSAASHDRDLNDDDGVPVTHPGDSPVYQNAVSVSGSSSHRGEDYVKVHLPYPNELGHDDYDAHDHVSRVHSRDGRSTHHNSRAGSIQRHYSHHTSPRQPPRTGPPRDLPQHSPTESGDSTEEFLNQPDPGRRQAPPPHMSRPPPQPYYDHNYPHSNSSSSHYGPPVTQQLIHHQPAPVPYPQHQYPPPMSGGPPPMGYPAPSQISYQYPPSHGHPTSHHSSPYAASPYHQSMVPSQYGAPTGYFPPHQPPYGQPYPPPPQQYPPQYMQYPPPMPMQMPPYLDINAYRVQSPAQSGSATASDSAKDKLDQEELMKRFEALMKQSTEDKHASETSKEEALRKLTEQMKADTAAAAAAAAQRSAEESRMREEARQEVLRGIEEDRKRAAEQSAREERIRQEATEAAIKAREAEAKAAAERAALEKKIAEDAAAAAKSAAEKEAKEAAEAKEAEAKKAKEEAEAKVKELEEAAAKAKADAEAAEKKAAENAPPEKKAPVRFKDAIGRNYNFPFERCAKWRDMEALINQAFAHVEKLADWVHGGHYDLLGPDGEIIMPEYWRETIAPDMQITMMLWPFPEPKEDPEPVVPPLEEGSILNLDDILNDTGGGQRKPRKPRASKAKPSGLGMWMLGGSKGGGGKKHLKGDKKPEVAAGSQHGADPQVSCTVM